MADFQNILKRIEAIRDAVSDAHLLAGSNLIAAQIARIHARGEATDGSQIGTYSDAAYFTSIDRFVSKGRIPKDKISKNEKWVQLPEGYKSFREYSGRQTAFVDLDYTSLMRQSYRFAPTPSGFQCFYEGRTNKESLGVTPIQKLRYAEKNFGKDIIAPSIAERRLIVDTYTKAISRAIISS